MLKKELWMRSLISLSLKVIFISTRWEVCAMSGEEVARCSLCGTGRGLSASFCMPSAAPAEVSDEPCAYVYSACIQ